MPEEEQKKEGIEDSESSEAQEPIEKQEKLTEISEKKEEKPHVVIHKPEHKEHKVEHKPEHKHKEEIKEHKEKKSFIKIIDEIYDKKYKQLLIIPAVLLIFCIGVIGFTIFTTGDFIYKGVSLKGGFSVSVSSDKQITVEDLQSKLRSEFRQADISVRALTRAGDQVGISVDVSGAESDEIINALEPYLGKLSKDHYSIDTMGPSLGASFFKETLIAILIAFFAMAIVVFLYFRAVAPSFYVILSAIADALFALAVIDILQIKISTAGIAAFLMLIGYSIDTDILLTTRVLKGKEGTVHDRVIGSLKTGLTMTIAAIAAVVIAYFSTQSEMLKQIMLILFLGLVADIINTWITNVSLLRWYVEKRHKIGL